MEEWENSCEMCGSEVVCEVERRCEVHCGQPDSHLKELYLKRRIEKTIARPNPRNDVAEWRRAAFGLPLASSLPSDGLTSPASPPSTQEQKCQTPTSSRAEAGTGECLAALSVDDS